MIEVTFLGVGEAFDEAHPNTSILIRYREGSLPLTLLLDCGFTAPPEFWKEGLDVDGLDGIWISHFHGDHCYGLPALLVRFWEDGRRKDLVLLGQRGIESFTRKCLDLAYPGFNERLNFPIKFLEVEPGKDEEILGLRFQTAENGHPQRDLALRINAKDKSVFYSGDGKPARETMALAEGSQLIIHETFHLETEIPGHGNVAEAIDMAKGCKASNLAVVHIQRQVRKQVINKMEELKALADPVNFLVPEPGDKIIL